MDATERLGGQYSPHLHPRCTHLVVQISFFIIFMMIVSVDLCFIKEKFILCLTLIDACKKKHYKSNIFAS